MKFDLIVSNPPYHQVMDTAITGLNKATYSPIYHQFIDVARELNPRLMVFITPARWYTEGRHLEDWRPTMLNDKRIKVIIDYVSSRTVFGRQVLIHGGVCIFLWDRDKTTRPVSVFNEGEQLEMRTLNDYDVFIRDNAAAGILAKIHPELRWYRRVARKSLGFGFFNMQTNYEPPSYSLTDKKQIEQAGDGCTLYTNEGTTFMDWNDLPFYPRTKEMTECKAMVDQWKVIMTKCATTHKRDNKKIFHRCDVIAPPSATTGTYFIAGHFDNEEEAQYFRQYLITKFARFLISLRCNTQHISVSRLQFLPGLEYIDEWTDEELYSKFRLEQHEIDHIEKTIAPWHDAPPIQPIAPA